MPNILDEIVESKKREVSYLKDTRPIADLKNQITHQKLPLNLSGSLFGSSVRIIAEVKKASPTRGVLVENFNPKTLASIYTANGAAAISVLTNTDHFHGSIADLETVSSIAHAHGIPVLRKDFIFDTYQIYESRASGADAILLIVSILSQQSLVELLALSHEHRMQCLVEIHDETELDIALESGAEIIGINNRNLQTFETNLATTERLSPLIPENKVIVSESGIHNRKDIQRIMKAGAHAALIGEALTSAHDVATKLSELI